MKTRLEDYRVIPDKPTYICVEVPNREPHHLRLLTASQQLRTDELVGNAVAEGRQGAVVCASVAQLGLAWFHESIDLETPPPDGDTDLDWRRYSEAVQRELEDEGYAAFEITWLAGKLQAAMRDRVKAQMEALDLAVFGLPPTDTKVLPSQKSQSLGEIPEPGEDGATTSE